MRVQGLRVYSPPEVDRIGFWVHYSKIPIYPIFYLLKGDYRVRCLGFRGLGFRVGARPAAYEPTSASASTSVGLGFP